MGPYRETLRRRGSKGCWIVAAVVGLGAAPPEVFRADRVALPPVVAAPDDRVIPVGGTDIGPPPLAVPKQMAGKVPPASDAPPPSPPAAGAPAPPVPAESPVPDPVSASPGSPSTRVYVFGGVDFGLAGLSGTVDRLRASGYPDTRIGGLFQGRRFEREIRTLSRQAPGTPVVVIGYSFGAYQARALVNRLTRDGIPVAMVGYIGGDYLSNGNSSRPAGVAQVVNVRGDGFLLTGRNLFFNGTDLTGAENLRLRGVRHFDLPKREETFAALMGGLDAATGRPAVATSSPPSSVALSPAPAAVAASQPPAPPAAEEPPPGPRTRTFTRLVDRLR